MLDYSCIGTVAQHCDLSKLCVAETEASNFDMAGLFCDFWYDILAFKKEVDDYDANPNLKKPDNYEQKKALVYGGTFTACNGSIRPFEGVVKIWTYYSYSRYVIINGFNDTATGMVTKTNEFSIPKTLKELEMFADKYRTMGRELFNRLTQYLCNQRELFTNYNSIDCKGCGCGCSGCSTKTTAKGYGWKGSNITL